MKDEKIEATYTAQADRGRTTVRFDVMDTGIYVKVTVTLDGVEHVFNAYLNEIEDIYLAASSANSDMQDFND